MSALLLDVHSRALLPLPLLLAWLTALCKLSWQLRTPNTAELSGTVLHTLASFARLCVAAEQQRVFDELQPAVIPLFCALTPKGKV